MGYLHYDMFPFIHWIVPKIEGLSAKPQYSLSETLFGHVNEITWLGPTPMWLVWHLRRGEGEGTDSGGGRAKERPPEKLTLLAL